MLTEKDDFEPQMNADEHESESVFIGVHLSRVISQCTYQ